MARRRLEAQYKCDKALERGIELKEDFTENTVKKEISVHHTYTGVYSMQFSPDTDLLAVGYGNGAVEIFNSTTGERISCVRKSRYGGLPIMCLRFNPIEPKVLLGAGSEGMVVACNLEDQSCTDFIRERGNEINTIDFSVDGMRCATAGRDLSIRIYDSTTGQLVREYEGYNPDTAAADRDLQGHGKRVFALKYHPEHEETFVTGGWDNCLKVWDSRSRDGVKRTIGGPHICGDGLDIEGYKVLTASWISTNSLQLWNYSTGQLEQNIPVSNCGGKGQFLYAAQFCDNDTVICGGSGICSAQAINYKTGELICNVKSSGAVQALDGTLGGRFFALGGMGESIKLVHMQ